MMAPREFENRSTGPKSEAGKLTVSKNSLVHGLSGKTHAALPGEEECYAEYCREMIAALAPVGVVEHAIASDIAASRFRLNRAHGMEQALFAKTLRDSQVESAGSDDPNLVLAEAFNDPAKGLQRIALYAARIQRALDKATARLEAMQAERKAAFAKAQEEAVLLTQLAQSEGKVYDHAADFPAATLPGQFAYSAPEIERLISRAWRLDEARKAGLPSGAQAPAAGK